MKKIYYGLIAIMLPLCVACNGYLDKPDSDDVTVEKAFETVQNSQKVLNNLYGIVRDKTYNIVSRRIPYAQACDDAVAGSSLWGLKFQQGTWTPDDDRGNVMSESVVPTTSFWNATYSYVRKANLFIENIHLAKGEEDMKIRMVAEARFLRAYYYSELIKRYGGVIILDHSIDGGEYSELINQPRNTFEESVDWVCNEFEEAAKDLPDKYSDSETGRATSIACYAAEARLRLIAASPLFNTDSPVSSDYTTTQYYGNYDKRRWDLAAEACRKVMANSKYYLYDGDSDREDVPSPDSWENYYRRFVDMYFKVTPELIWFSWDMGEWDNVRIAWVNRSSGGWNWINPTYQLAKEYELIDGTMPSDQDMLDVVGSDGKNRDPRFKATISYPGAQYDAFDYQPWMGGPSYEATSVKTGMSMQKYIDPLYKDNDANMNRTMVRRSIHQMFRYAEVLLNFAEAVNESTGPTSEVYDAINAVRGRVGMPAIESGLTQEEMREKIRHERRVELAFEDFRFFDVRRWRIAETVLNDYLKGYDVTKKVDGGFKTIVNVGNKMVFEKKHYLYPLHTKEILMNPALEQNPGWPRLSTNN